MTDGALHHGRHVDDPTAAAVGLVTAKVERDAPLGRERGRSRRSDARPPRPAPDTERIRPIRRLDLHDVGTVVGQEPAAERAGDQRPELENTDPAEGSAADGLRRVGRHIVVDHVWTPGAVELRGLSVG